jgi:hypothetical protein
MIVASKSFEECKQCHSEKPPGQFCKHNQARRPDHDHATGEVCDMLCFTCNVALGDVADDSELLQRAINYLKGVAWPSILRESPGVYRLCS